MKKIIRNLTDEAGRNFWAAAQRSAEGVSTWPDWRKAGITTEQPGVDAPQPLSRTEISESAIDRSREP
jgi:hypothetical protein